MWAYYYSKHCQAAKWSYLHGGHGPNHRNWKSPKLDAWLVHVEITKLSSTHSWGIFQLPQLRATLRNPKSGPCSTTIYIEGGQVLPQQFAQKIIMPLQMPCLWSYTLPKMSGLLSEERGVKKSATAFSPACWMSLPNLQKTSTILDSACLRDAGVALQGGRKPQQNWKVEGRCNLKTREIIGLIRV